MKNNMSTENFWDLKAESFDHTKRNESSELAKRVVDILNTENMLSNNSILDIGGGTGRYAIPFAQNAKSVTVTDISTNMLEIAKNNAVNVKITNIDFIKLDWNEANIKELGWENTYDLVFASMCPAVKDKEGIAKMISSSRKYCFINQFIETSDYLSQAIEKELNISKSYDPHNDRDSVSRIFNYLWDLGYEPEISYLKENTERTFLLEDAVKQYNDKFYEVTSEKRFNLSDVILDVSKNNQIRTTISKTLAMISWKI